MLNNINGFAAKVTAIIFNIITKADNIRQICSNTLQRR